MMQLIIHVQEITFCCRLQKHQNYQFHLTCAVVIKNDLAKAENGIKKQFVEFLRHQLSPF